MQRPEGHESIIHGRHSNKPGASFVLVVAHCFPPGMKDSAPFLSASQATARLLLAVRLSTPKLDLSPFFQLAEPALAPSQGQALALHLGLVDSIATPLLNSPSTTPAVSCRTLSKFSRLHGHRSTPSFWRSTRFQGPVVRRHSAKQRAVHVVAGKLKLISTSTSWRHAPQSFHRRTRSLSGQSMQPASLIPLLG